MYLFSNLLATYSYFLIVKKTILQKYSLYKTGKNILALLFKVISCVLRNKKVNIFPECVYCDTPF